MNIRNTLKKRKSKKTKSSSEKPKDVNAGVQKAIDECVSKNILKDFLIEKQSEVIAMCLFKFDKEKYEDTLKRKAKNQGCIETLISLVKD